MVTEDCFTNRQLNFDGGGLIACQSSLGKAHILFRTGPRVVYDEVGFYEQNDAGILEQYCKWKSWAKSIHSDRSRRLLSKLQ